MKKLHKLGVASIALAFGAVVLSSCTANFCSVKEKSRILFAVEPGVSEYFDSQAEAEAEAAKYSADEGYTYVTPEQISGTNIWQLVLQKNGDYLVKKEDGQYTGSDQLNSIISTAKKSNFVIPSAKYFAWVDQKVLLKAIDYAKSAETDKDFSSINKEEAKRILKNYGFVKFFGSEEKKNKKVEALWTNFDSIYQELRFEKGIENVAGTDFVSCYKQNLESAINNNRSCITSIDGEYGSYGVERSTKVHMDSETWGQAFGHGGAVIEGLIVYPVSCLVDAFANAFAGHNPENFSNGVPQILALLLATIIVRLFIFLVSFKSTLTQQKMTQLQPELQKIQAKYPNSNTNAAQKQRMAEEQMKLYRKYKVNPLSSLLVLIIQFPIFIGVWGAMTGNAILSTGSFLGLNLSTSVWDALTKVNKVWTGGWWTALVLFLLMAVSQFFAMKVPQWIQKRKAKKVARLSKNPAQTQQNRTMNIVSWVMLIMIVFMGFTLPAAMGFYWFVGALVSLAQSLITNAIFSRKRK